MKLRRQKPLLDLEPVGCSESDCDDDSSDWDGETVHDEGHDADEGEQGEKLRDRCQVEGLSREQESSAVASADMGVQDELQCCACTLAACPVADSSCQDQHRKGFVDNDAIASIETEEVSGSAACQPSSSSAQPCSPASCSIPSGDGDSGVEDNEGSGNSSNNSAEDSESDDLGSGGCSEDEQSPLVRQLHQCWICFGDGFVMAHELQDNSHSHESSCESTYPQASNSQHAVQPCSSGHSSSCSSTSSTATTGCLDNTCDHDNGTAGACGALLEPCSVCCGSLRFVHQGCFAKWLQQSWSPNCPNCARPLIRSALDSVPAGQLLGTLLDGLGTARSQAADSDDGDDELDSYGMDASSRRPATKCYPPGCLVSFALGGRNGQVHVKLPCAWLTVTAVAQQMVAIATEIMQCAADDDDESPGKMDQPSPMATLAALQAVTTVLLPDTTLYGDTDELIPGVAYASYVRPQDVQRSSEHALAEDRGVDASNLWHRLLLRRNEAMSGPGMAEVPPVQHRLARSHRDIDLERLFDPHAWLPDPPLPDNNAAGWASFGFFDEMYQGAGAGRLAGRPHRFDQFAPAPLPTPQLQGPGERNAWVRQQLASGQAGRALAADLRQAVHGGGGSTANGPRHSVHREALQQQQQQQRRNNQHQQRQRASGRRRS